MWTATEELLNPRVSAEVADLFTLDVTDSAVTLPRLPDTERPGRYGLWWSGGTATVGDVLAVEATVVRRELISGRPRGEPGHCSNARYGTAIGSRRTGWPTAP